ncbi:hypothetical protein [Methylobacterium persicinum]|uniref:Uncharacterized protein n=1 Tax=Methylobacterium persicinum TaxID=374426 RepID=A0ABU0HV50_9HYPH|nr:hypothetical protein [Methylobacterium persicinum]MDQ0445376.1 hypothetical protein [Methylobacterium persicinum]GJE40542.1 hypothetical protein KHHGKMAE_4637 [Methylobacterium persicinum]
MSPPPTTSSPGRFALAIAAVWLLLFALYILCAGSLSLNEGLAGAVTAALGSIWWAFAGRGGGMRFSGWMSGLGPVGHAILGLPGATGRVAGQLVHAVIGGGPRGSVAYERDAESAWANAELPAERALGLIAASLAPDSFVLREKGGDTGIVMHTLAPVGGKP